MHHSVLFLFRGFRATLKLSKYRFIFSDCPFFVNALWLQQVHSHSGYLRVWLLFLLLSCGDYQVFSWILANSITVEPPCATTYSKHQNFPRQSPIIRTLRKRPPLISDRNHFLAWRFYSFPLSSNSCKRPLDLWWGPLIVRSMYYGTLDFQWRHRPTVHSLLTNTSLKKTCMVNSLKLTFGTVTKCPP